MPGPAPTREAPPTPTAALLARLGRPYEPVRSLVALLGTSERTARQIVGTILATSQEAQHLLATMPGILRSLSIATADRPTRCYGELRGPVLWSETMSARSASAGDLGLYVCATTTKAYDTDANRVLKAALAALHRAGHDAEGHDAKRDPLAHQARANGARAFRFMEHQALVSVPEAPVSGRALLRARTGSRRSTYRPALGLLRRAGDPLGAEHLEVIADDATLADHALLATVLRDVEVRRGTLPPLRTAHGDLVAGPVRYCHPGHGGRHGGPAGVTLDGRPVPGLDALPSARRAR